MLRKITRLLDVFIFCLVLGPIAGFTNTPDAFINTPDPFQDNGFIFEPVYGNGNYTEYANYINPDEIKIILEVGSRDAIDAIRLGYYYRCPTYAFECNPAALELCYYNAKNYPYVTIVPYACWNETKEVSFYPVVQSHGGALPVNIGGSSLLVTREDGCDSHHIQGDPITVQAVRLDEWMEENGIEHIDLLCMDTQGATLQVLQGLGKYLSKVKYLITEAYLQPAFEGESLYPEIKEMLTDAGFDVAREPTQGIQFCDVLFINRNFSNPE